MNEKTGVYVQTPKAPIKRIGTKVEEIKVRTMGIIIDRVTMFEMVIKTATPTSNGVTMVTETIRVGPMFHLKIGKLLLGMVEVVWCEFMICCRR